MSSDAIFLKQGDHLVELRSEDYESEELLQQLLANYPDLLAGGQMDEQSPRRWLLINRELGLPAEEQGVARFAVDHLFVDQDGVPTIVEVKRSSDTRLRREVVGQMLDYAANSVRYWPIGELRLGTSGHRDDGRRAARQETGSCCPASGMRGSTKRPGRSTTCCHGSRARRSPDGTRTWRRIP